ncbi:MAG TPA: multidrug efflux RND transporter permease subunit [Holophagaceae bacterium]|nr:multidrug efflux RND transporter permease subunit [Holophagaceae bacterium]
MSLSAPFIRRPVATTLMAVAIALAGSLAYKFLPVSPLPQVEFPTIQVQAGLPGASPETMASSVATPLERQFSRIAGVTEMTSVSSLGSTNVTLQFDLDRNVDAAGRDVQAAINAARGQLPTGLPSNPSYRKVNPSDAPIMLMALSSELVERSKLYDLASSILQQKLAQVSGVGQVVVGGGALPAVRVEVNPGDLNAKGVALEEIRATLAAANVNKPKGSLADAHRSWSIQATDQLFSAKDYIPLVVSYKKGVALRLGDVARVTDGLENVQATGLANGKPAILLIIFRQPGANIIETADRVQALIPELQASLPPTMDLRVVLNTTRTIRASVMEVERTLLISVALVILVVFLFLRSARTTLIPSVAVPISLIGTFGVMYLLGYSIDNLSLMALTVATGFVVDDAIVVVENIMRHVEEGVPPMAAAFQGAKEIGFTVVSISISLVAVFIPILLMGGIVGRLFREFAVTLSVAIAMSMVVSLTLTPMMSARLLRSAAEERHGRFFRATERGFQAILGFYERSLRWVLKHPFQTALAWMLTVIASIVLWVALPKGFFPQQDTGRLAGSIQADQSTSFQAMKERMNRFAAILQEDPAVENVMVFLGGGSATNSGRCFIALKPWEQRKGVTADMVIARLRPKLGTVPGASLFLQAVQDLRIGGRPTGAQYQYTLQADDSKDLFEWGPKMVQKMRSMPLIADISTDQQNQGLQASLVIDRDTASRLGVTPRQVDDTLYSAFGQRQVSTIYTQMNQYHVVLGVEPRFWQDPDTLQTIYVRSSRGELVPLSAFCRYDRRTAPLSVSHQGQSPAVTISYNLAPGVALGQAVAAIDKAGEQILMPSAIRGKHMGSSQAFQDSLANMPLLILAAFLVVYIVLGVLYESLIHPITILSTLPSAGVGALLALMLFRLDLSVIATIGIILLIGIVKKNAILMIDFAIEVERKQGVTPDQAIFQACLLRFRPITMTTLAALLGGLPLALGTGTGSELRRPLGVAIVGGLLFSQVLTLYTTPVIYLYLDRFRIGWARLRGFTRRSGKTIVPTES